MPIATGSEQGISGQGINGMKHRWTGFDHAARNITRCEKKGRS
jgi:hypothetical protein